MAKYTVTWTRTSTHSVEVEADSEDEAVSNAHDFAPGDGDTYQGGDDTSDWNAELIEDDDEDDDEDEDEDDDE